MGRISYDSDKMSGSCYHTLVMKSEITKRTDTEVTLNISASEAELQHALEHAYAKFRPQVKASGFRPGKAPDHIVAREIGDANLQSEVIDHALNHAYGDAIREHEVQTIGSPTVNIKKWVPYTTLEFEAIAEVVPPVTLPDYKAMKKPFKPANISKEQIDEVVDDLRRRVAKRVPALRPAEMGDEVTFDFEGKKDGVPFEGGTSKEYTLKLGSGNFIPGFEEQLVGLNVEDEKTLPLTFPQNYHEKSLAGKPVEFDVKIHQVTKLELPEVNDGFAAEVGPFATVNELRDDVKKQLELEAEEAAKREYENELLDEIIAKSKVEAPEQLVSQQLERLKADISQRLASSGMTMEQYLQMQKKTQEELEAEMRPEAEKRVKLALILSEVSRQENITVSLEEIDNEITGLKARYNDPHMQKELNGERIREDVYNHLMATKVVNKLVEYAQA